MAKQKQSDTGRRYQVALSFAGEDREYVERVAEELKRKKISVFYDRYEEANLWGKNLYDHLQDVYANQAAFTVIFISRHYAQKLWTNHERQSAQARAFNERKEYILPARFDDAKIPGILETIGYIDLRSKSPQQVADLIGVKLGASLDSAPIYPQDEIADPAENIATITHVRTELDRNEHRLPVLDVIVRNNSDAVCVITQARAHVEGFWHIGQVWITPHALPVSFEYQLGICGGTGTDHSVSLAQELRPKTADRFHLVLGPKDSRGQWYPALGQFLFLLRIALVYNETRQLLDLPPVFVQLPPPWAINASSSHGVPEGAIAEQYRKALEAREAARHAVVVDQRAVSVLDQQIEILKGLVSS
jgi:hypothetical protein